MDIRKLFMISAVIVPMSFTGVRTADCAGKSSSGWTIYRQLRSVRPTALSVTRYLPGDISGMLHNPSMLAFLSGREINFDTGMGSAVDERIAGLLYGQKQSNGLVIGAGVFSYDYGRMSLHWIEDGMIQERTVSAEDDYMGLISCAGRINANMHWGGSLKFASSRIAEMATAYSAAFDGGVNYSYGHVLVSLIGQNIGLATKFIDKAESLPAALGVGASYLGNFAGFYTLTGVEIPYLLYESSCKPSVGFEIGRWPIGVFAGYRTYVDDAALTCGISIAVRERYDFSYSYTPSQWLGSMHRVAVSIKLNHARDQREDIRSDYKRVLIENKKKEEESKRELLRQREEEVRIRERIVQEMANERDKIKQRLMRIASSSDAVDAFYVLDVIDARKTESLGYASQQESSGRKTALRLQEGLTSFIKNNIDLSWQRDPKRIPVVIRVKTLMIREGADREKAEANIDFYVLAGDQVGRICATSSVFEKSFSEWDPDSHLRNVKYVLNDCVRQFMNSAWANKDVIYRDKSVLFQNDPEDHWTKKRHIGRFGLGYGIPYGVFGTNLEINTCDYFSLISAVGYAPAGVTYSFGGKLYFADRSKRFRPCLSAYYGVVALLEKRYFGMTQSYENINGTALGFGFEYNRAKTSWSFEVLDLNYSFPPGTEKIGGDIKISFGYGWHF